MTQTSGTTRPLLGSRLLRAPRLVRILVAAVSAFAFALLIDRLFEASFFDEQGAGTTLLISTVVGLIAYAIGWWLMIGFGQDGEPPARRALPIYLVLSAAALIVAIALAIIWLVITYGSGG